MEEVPESDRGKTSKEGDEIQRQQRSVGVWCDVELECFCD